MQQFIVFLAQGLGSGKVKKAPGTFGSLAAVLVFYALFAPLSWQFQLVIILFTSIFGIWLCDKASKILGIDDPSSVVWDEWAGMWIALFSLPVHWAWYLAAFVLFRLFDITKPGVIGRLDKNLHGGLGIMLDDIVAGIFSMFILQITYFLIFDAWLISI